MDHLYLEFYFWLKDFKYGDENLSFLGEFMCGCYLAKIDMVWFSQLIQLECCDRGYHGMLL